MSIKHCAAAAAALLLVPTSGEAGSALDGFNWLQESDDIHREGIIWNDRFGDGKDRYKSGGLTQSFLIPDQRISDQNWFDGHAAALELQGRGFVATPNNLAAGGTVGDRPFTQYVGIGAYLRTFESPQTVGPDRTQAIEDRFGIELGYQGEPLPLFDLQEAIHSDGSFNQNPALVVGGEFLANLEARRTVRWHQQLNDTDLEIAPYAQASFGMRENSVRVGGDVIYGESLEGRTWNIDPAIGALIPGGSPPRTGSNWMMWLGGDVGYVASDAFLDGGFASDDYSVAREEIVGRVRVGFMFEYDDVALGYSLTWMSEEFENQSHSQVIGAISVKYRF